MSNNFGVRGSTPSFVLDGNEGEGEESELRCKVVEKKVVPSNLRNIGENGVVLRCKMVLYVPTFETMWKKKHDSFKLYLIYMLYILYYKQGIIVTFCLRGLNP